MKIEVENLGAINKATIDLSQQIILFCGQNNTGKTYLSFIIYALTKFKLVRDKIITFDVSELLENGSTIAKVNVDNLYKFKGESISSLKKNLDTVFGISEEQAEHLFDQFNIKLLLEEQECYDQLSSMSFSGSASLNSGRFEISKEANSLDISIKLLDNEDYSNFIKDQSMLHILLNSAVVNRLAFHPISNSIIFPVERNSINTFSKELSINRNILIEQMQKLSSGDNIDPFEFISGSSNRYPLAIKDGLMISDDLQNRQKQKSELFEVAEELEQTLLNGTLSVTKDGNLQFSSNKRKTKKLPIHMTASIVKTLSSLIFYLKYQANKGDMIIIDEPEMNLHPDSQIVLARVFAKLYNLGFRLLISTHSDYIIREFNNLIMTSSSSKEMKEISEEIGYQEDEKINPKNIGCYYFHYPSEKSRKVTVKKIDISNDGFEIESIDREITNQNERMEALFSGLDNIE